MEKHYFSHFVIFVTQFSGNKKKYQNLDGDWKPTNLIFHSCHIDYDYFVDLDSPDLVGGLLTFSKLSELPLLHVPQENRSVNETKCNYVTT